MNFKAKDSSNNSNLKRPSKLLTKYNSLDSKDVTDESGKKADSDVAVVVAPRTAITPSPGQEAGKQVGSTTRTSIKPKINHHSINPSQQASEIDQQAGSMVESGGGSSGGKSSAGPPLATAKKLQPALSTSFSSNQLNSVKSVQNSQFDSSRSGSITSIMYAKSKLSSGYR